MFPMLFRLMWMRTRTGLAIVVIAGFMVPLFMLAGGGGLRSGDAPVDAWLRQAELMGQLLPVATVFLGVYLGIMAWADDHLGGHVYALSLPVRRELFALYRFGSGAILLVIPAVALLAGSLIATAAVSLPGGVHAYPLALFGRFVLASFAAIGALLLGQLLFLLAGSSVNLVAIVLNGLTTWPGPFEVLTGRWALFDV
jgi:hypothetical protein